MRKVAPLLTVLLLALPACGGDDDDDAPPPVASGPTGVTGVNNIAAGTGGAPPGQVMVTVVANSTPGGARVTGGGRELGTTPLSTQVPVPAPTPGQDQTFAFTFELEGYQPATINASPVNQTISITAALAPVVGGGSSSDDDDDDGDDDDSSSGGRRLNITGRGGGPIVDFQTTRAHADVNESCIVQRLRVRIRGNHTYYGDLVVTLQDPSGRNYTLQSRSSRNPFRSYNISRARGQQARGRWNLAIADQLRADSGRLSGWNMQITCR